MNIKYNAVPVLRLTVAGNPTLKKLAEEILMALGDPSPSDGTTHKKTNRIVKLVHMAKTRTMIIDDFQNLFYKNMNTAMHVSDLFVFLADRCGIVLIISDLESAKALHDAFPQLSRRAQVTPSTTRFNPMQRNS